MNNSIVSDAFGHHVWATRRMLDACAALTEDQLTATVPGTYGPILDMLRHIVGADASYLSLLTGGEVAEVEEDTMSLAELRQEIEVVDEGWRAFLATEFDPDADVVRHRDDGTTSHAPMSIRLVQATQHGTDHRSQVSTALTSLGIEPPDLDVWAFADAHGRLAADGS